MLWVSIIRNNQKKKIIAFSEEPFDPRRGMVAEEKERIWYEKTHLIALFNDGG